MSKYIYASLGTLIAILMVSNAWLYGSLDKTKKELHSANKAIEIQNATIKQNALDFEAYKKQNPKVKEKIVVQYKEIPTDTSAECETQLNALRETLDIFFNRGQ